MDFGAFVPSLFNKLVVSLRESNKLPTEEDHIFFQKYPKFTSEMKN
jgi:hypothetical protein